MEKEKSFNGCFLLIIITMLIIGLFYTPVLMITLLIVAMTGAIIIVKKIIKKHRNKKLLEEQNRLVEYYTDEVTRLGAKKDVHELFELYSKISVELPSKVSEIFFISYFKIVDSFLSKREINTQEATIIAYFKKFTSDTEFANDILVRRYLDTDVDFINTLINNLDVGEKVRNDLMKIKINHLTDNGLKPLEIKNGITAEKICYYFSKVSIEKIRTSGGIRYNDFDKKSDLYIFGQTVELIFDGHRVIKIADIIQMNVSDGLLLLTLRNIGSPLIIKSKEPEFIEAIIIMIKQL